MLTAYHPPNQGPGSSRAGEDDDGSAIRRPARLELRDRTRKQHEATEEAFAAYDLSKRDHYRAFLTAHAIALPGLEIAVTGRGWKGFHPRLPLLADDLAALGTWLPTPMIASDTSEAGVWGVQYVLEGSKLGGKMLSRGLAADLPSKYLSPATSMSAEWQAFCAAFDEAAIMQDSAWLEEATDAAIESFQFFRRAAKCIAEDLV